MNAAYLEWLKREAEKDKAAKQSGRPELPRSEQERAAIFSVLPVQERRRVKNRQRAKAERQA
jgi:hypothetical protein